MDFRRGGRARRPKFAPNGVRPTDFHALPRDLSMLQLTCCPGFRCAPSGLRLEDIGARVKPGRPVKITALGITGPRAARILPEPVADQPHLRAANPDKLRASHCPVIKGRSHADPRAGCGRDLGAG
jgi:hypothetical protein